MAWEVWWALILGFALSGIVQAWVSHQSMERVLGGRGLKATLKATGLGAASSSCSCAAIAIAKSTLQKGAGLPAAIAFMFASTNLVFELGIVLWIFLGPAFTAAEFAGGFLLILMMWGAVRFFVSEPEEEGARTHAQEADTGHAHAMASCKRTLREQLTSLQAWSDVAHNFRGDWQNRFALKLSAMMLAAMVLAALVVDLVFSGLGVIPETRPSIESITDRGIKLNYTAVLNILFTFAGAALVWLTVRRGAKDPVCRMRVDRYATAHRTAYQGHTYFFCTAGCQEEVQSKPEHYAHHARYTRGNCPRGLLRPRA